MALLNSYFDGKFSCSSSKIMKLLSLVIDNILCKNQIDSIALIFKQNHYKSIFSGLNLSK